jgi:3-deoxy-D-manno-octulosonic-acid transferase
VRSAAPSALLLIAPRHPDRGGAVRNLAASRGLVVQLRSADRDPPIPLVDVVVADTLGEMSSWYDLAASVYLGGATAERVGGHNPIEALALGRGVATGPFGYNFKEVFPALEARGLLTICRASAELAAYWRDAVQRRAPPDAAVLAAFLDTARQPLASTLAAIHDRLPPAHA